MRIDYFEEIDSTKLEDYYSKELKIGSETIEVDINFDSDTLSIEQTNKLNSCLQKLSTIKCNSWEWIMEDLKNGEDVSDYISFHLDDFFEDNPEEILEGTDPSLNNRDRFLKTLKVNRIGIYPESQDSYISIDWMTNPDLSNYILVVICNDKFELEYITIES